MATEYFPKVLVNIIEKYAEPEENVYTNKYTLLNTYNETIKTSPFVSADQVNRVREIISNHSYTVTYIAVYNSIGKIRDFSIYKNDEKKTLVLHCEKGKIIESVDPMMSIQVMRRLDEYTNIEPKLPTETVWDNVMIHITARIGHIEF